MENLEFLAAAFKLLSKVPEGIWGVLLGSLITLFGIWIANRQSLKLQKLQFEFESNERRRERQLQLRRDVYLPAADAVVGMAGCIGRAFNLSIPDQEFNRATETFGVAVARMQMVAAEETIRQVSEVQRAFLRELMGIVRDRHSLMLRQSDINLAVKWMQTHQEERQRYIEMMKAYNLEGVKDVNRWNAIERQVEFVSKALANEAAKWEQLSAEQLKAQIELTRTFPERLMPLMELQTRALVAIRMELELTGEESVLLEELEITANELRQSLGSTVQMLEEMA